LYLGREGGDGGGGLGAPGANKRTGTCLYEGVAEAACRTCRFAGIIESSNFVRKSMPIMGVATAARKKSILCKNLLSLRCLMILSNPCYQVGFCTDHISTILKCATVVQLFVVGSCFCGWCVGGGVQYSALYQVQISNACY
jgi:hypothetical protein